MTSTNPDIKDAEDRRSSNASSIAPIKAAPIKNTTDDELDKEVLMKDSEPKKEKKVSIKKKKDANKSDDNADDKPGKKKKKAFKSLLKFLYNPKRKTVLGRSSLNWAKLAGFYTVFYFFLGSFFFGLIYIFAITLDRHEPRYFDTESTMAVRSTAGVVGMGFRPQPAIDENLIRISDNPEEQWRIAKSLDLFRRVFLHQKETARVKKCTADSPASELNFGYACDFDWSNIVTDKNHPCSYETWFGFKYEQPCILVKLNKVYGWTPRPGPIPEPIQALKGINKPKDEETYPDVYITCSGTNVADSDVLTKTTYYSLDNPLGSSKYGAIPNHYFPYRNAKDHVQPFVLVQFNKIPHDRLVSVTCRAWAPGIEHDTRGMQGMVSFQLLRTQESKEAQKFEPN